MNVRPASAESKRRTSIPPTEGDALHKGRPLNLGGVLPDTPPTSIGAGAVGGPCPLRSTTLPKGR